MSFALKDCAYERMEPFSKRNVTTSIQAHFGDVEDPRQTYLNDHPLINILTIALCAIVAGAEGWTDIKNFGRQKQT